MNTANRLLSLVAIAAVAVGTFGLSAPAANAETLHTKHAKTVKITPAALAPAGAKVTKSVITVKLGSKTVAKNKTSYKAKTGTYKVTTTVTFRRSQLVKPAATDVFTQCRITAVALTSDRTSWRSLGSGTGYYAGQATFTYTGSCADTIYLRGEEHYVTWVTTWQDDDYIVTDIMAATGSRTAAVIADADYGVGDSAYVDGTEMSALPNVKVWAAAQTVSKTRTVKVEK